MTIFDDAKKLIASGDIEAADLEVIEALHKMAIGYSVTEKRPRGRIDGKDVFDEVLKTFPPDSKAAIFWLTNRMPEQWKQVKSIEHSGSIRHRHSAELSDAELENIATGSSAGTAEPPPSEEKPSAVH